MLCCRGVKTKEKRLSLKAIDEIRISVFGGFGFFRGGGGEGVTSGSIQGLPWVLWSGITPGIDQGMIWDDGDQSQLAICKASGFSPSPFCFISPATKSQFLFVCLF